MRERKMYMNLSLCKECAGKCCQTLPGCLLPDDWAPVTKKKLFIAFSSGKWAVDWWDGEKRGYFIRPAIINANKLMDPSWGGACNFLGEKGCSLEANDRPAGCRLLEPGKEGCKRHGADKKEAAEAWEPYWDMIDEVAELTEERKK